MKPKSKVLIIAGSDSSGGAGIQADVKTVTALGSYAMTAITAITAQNTTGVKSIVSIPPKEIYNQIMFTIKDIKPDAIKIGMLHSSDVINKVVNSLNIIKVKKIILDPVMVAKGGTRLINYKAIQTLKKKLIKQVSLITPNIPEAEILTGVKINNVGGYVGRNGSSNTPGSGGVGHSGPMTVDGAPAYLAFRVGDKVARSDGRLLGYVSALHGNNNRRFKCCHIYVP